MVLTRVAVRSRLVLGSKVLWPQVRTEDGGHGRQYASAPTLWAQRYALVGGERLRCVVLHHRLSRGCCQHRNIDASSRWIHHRDTAGRPSKQIPKWVSAERQRHPVFDQLDNGRKWQQDPQPAGESRCPTLDPYTVKLDHVHYCPLRWFLKSIGSITSSNDILVFLLLFPFSVNSLGA